MKKKNLITNSITFVALLLVLSCNKNAENDEVPNNDIPKALQDDSFKIKRYSKRNSDLTDQLYQDLVKKSTELQDIENEIENFDPSETTEGFDNYNMKSKDYYLSSKLLTNRIHDSILKKKMVALLEKSKQNYFMKENEFNILQSKVNEKQKAIEDYHNILKIVLTLPIIEKYQKENLPSKSKFDDIIKKEDSIVEKIKKLTPKY